MRTLLIDNHDSFTFNLYQYLAACNAQPPLVVRNDDMTWEDAEKLGCDNIVISPGPGRPQRPADLGISADALRHARIPILGVCLGHQAMAYACGAQVDLAVRPMHGRLDRISHSGNGLFRGIPDRFEAVRYHSLAVTKLPEVLEALAWTSDGTLMALQHTVKPWWGVQFHPESICTEYGARLLRNFRDLTLEWQSRGALQSTFGSFVPAAQAATHTQSHVHAQCLDVFPDRASFFVRAFGASRDAFWLDSCLAQGAQAQFSFMGDACGPDACVLSYRSAPGQLSIRKADVVDTASESIFDYLSRHLAPAPAGPRLPFDFKGGFVGCFGYELKRELAGNHAHEAPTPDAVWIGVDRFIAFDHVEQQTWVVCVDQPELREVNRQWTDTMVALLSAPDLGIQTQTPDPMAASELAALQWSINLNDYRQRVLRCQQEILQGETYEVCLTNCLSGKGRIDALQVYLALRARNPAPYAAFFKSDDLAVLCASPELFLAIDEAGTVDSKPLKGTCARGATPSEDANRIETLVSDEKTRAENLMIVDLVRNDLNKVCEVDSVHVPSLFHVESFATVHQLVSTIRGRLQKGMTAVDCVRAAFPGGSMTGAPKERTMRIIDALEPTARGIYSGTLGYLSHGGSARLNIVIRTIVCAADHVSIGSGGAVVALSDPDEEVREIVLKARAQWDTLRQCGAPLGELDLVHCAHPLP